MIEEFTKVAGKAWVGIKWVLDTQTTLVINIALVVIVVIMIVVFVKKGNQRPPRWS